MSVYAMDFGMGYLLSKLFGDHCVNQLVRPTRIYLSYLLTAQFKAPAPRLSSPN